MGSLSKCRLKRFRDIQIDPKLFVTLLTGTILDFLLSKHRGLPPGKLYLCGGDPGTGKTTLLLDILANIQLSNPGSRVLFISFEMNEVDLADYMVRFPKFQDIDILFLDSNSIEDDEDVLDTMESVLSNGYHVVGLDSFVIAQGLVSENLGISVKRSENHLLKLMKKHMYGQNERKIMTTFISIQQMVKSGDFAGTMALKHAVDVTMELRLENKNNINSSRYIVFSKHRSGTPGQKLYYDLSHGGNVMFDENRFLQDLKIQEMHEKNDQDLRDAEITFDSFFNQNIVDEQ